MSNLFNQPVILGLEHGVTFASVNFRWNEDKTIFLYNQNYMTPLSVIIGITPPRPDIVILEISNG